MSTPETPREETTSRTVVGLFASRADAEAAITDLLAAGFARHSIGLAVQGEADPNSGTLMTVDAGVRTPEALEILERHHADLDATALREVGGVDWTARDNSAPAAAAPGSFGGADRRIIQDPAYSGPERRR